MKDRLIMEFPELIPADKVQWIKTIMRNNAQFGSGDSYNREGNTINITSNLSKSAELQQLDTYLLGVFGSLVQKIADTFKPDYSVADSGYEYHIYPPGKVCKQHGDGEVILGRNKYFPELDATTSLIRYATAVIYLTTNTGGELVFPDAGISIKPEAGKAVVFPPYRSYQHYSNTAKEDREIIMTWFVYSNINARFI